MDDNHNTSGRDRGHDHSHDHDHDHHHDHDNDDAVQEREHFQNVCSTYRQYGTFAMAQRRGEECRLLNVDSNYNNFPQRQGSISLLLPNELRPGTTEYIERQQLWKDAVIQNQFFFDLVLRHHGQPHSQQVQQERHQQDFATDDDISKLTSVLKSVVRDWSSEGTEERQQAYDPILNHVKKYLPLVSSSSDDVVNKEDTTPPPAPTQSKRICVPGSGVGRLAFELYCLGYEVQGNDFSLYMLLVSDFILNNGGQITPNERPIRISPYLLESKNSHSFQDRIRSIQIPDIDPAKAIEDAFGSDSTNGNDSNPPNIQQPDFSVAAGDFVGIYSHPKEIGQWDGVVSCFFLDACPNIIQTIQIIYRMLRPGGVLINLGPLLFHWSGPPYRPDDTTTEKYRQRYSHLDERYLSSIDMSWEDIRQVLINVGFELIDEKVGIECSYTADRRSMMRTTYNCVSFVARKKSESVDMA